MRRTLNKRISHDSAVYNLYRSDCGELILSLRSCNNESYVAGLDGEFIYDDIGDLNIGVEALGLMNKVKNAVVSWAISTQPESFNFEATTDRKKPIFDWFAKRILNGLEEHYTHTKNGEVHWFYKK